MKTLSTAIATLTLTLAAAITFVSSTSSAQYNRGPGDRGGIDRGGYDRGGYDRGQNRSGGASCRQVVSGVGNVAQVRCAPNEYALNGGGKCLEARGRFAVLIESIPLTDYAGLSNGWQADCHFADNSNGAQAQAFATCCSL